MLVSKPNIAFGVCHVFSAHQHHFDPKDVSMPTNTSVVAAVQTDSMTCGSIRGNVLLPSEDSLSSMEAFRQQELKILNTLTLSFRLLHAHHN